MNSGLISLFIPIIVIALAIITKRIIVSLITGIVIGGILLEKGNIVQGVVSASDHLIKSTATAENVYIIFFLFLFGAFAEIMKLSGGIKGFANMIGRYIKTERGALGAIWAVTPATFIDCCFHAIAAGTVGKALNEKVGGNRRKLAFVLNVTSCLLIVLIPFGTTYIGYIIGVLGSSFSKASLNQSAYLTYLKSIPFNFYAIVMILISVAVIVFNFGFKKEIKTKDEDSDFEKEHGHDEAHEQCEFEENAPPRPFNLILPLAFLITSTFFLLWLTGKGQGRGFFDAIVNADFEKSIFVSGLTTMILTAVYYLFQKVPLREIESHFLSGGGEMLPPIIVLILSWGLSSIISDLGFVDFISGAVASNLPKFLLPVTVFLLGCFASYFMGSAWGTWALIMPIALPIAVSTGSNIPLMVGAVLAGGSLGDNVSPLGETAILSSTISEIPLMEHIKSQLPYSLTGVAVSAVLFLVFALVLT